ncbi:MAG: hypothetical protein RL030_162 [Pseudomonadota bacterium]|jgi:hypothetical protein
MRTTLDIDDPLLEAIKELARRQGLTAGRVASDLIRHALTEPAAPSVGSSSLPGFRPFPAAGPGEPVSNEQLNRLRDTLGL